MRQAKLSGIFTALRRGRHVRGWTGSRQLQIDYIERLAPHECWERHRPTAAGRGS